MKTFAEEVKETLYEFANNYGLLVGDTHFDNYIIGNIKTLILQRIDSCPKVTTSAIITMVDGECKTIRTYAIPESDLHRAFGIEGKENCK